MKEKHALATKRCARCVHGFVYSERAYGCEYILNEFKRRPCPAGTACTEFKKGRNLQSLLNVVVAPVPINEAKAAAAIERRRRGKIKPKGEA